MRLLSVISAIAMIGVGGCAPKPLSPELAARVCADRAGLAQRPRGTVGVGIGTGGVRGGVGLTVSPDFLLGRDPQDVYDACFIERTGFPPMATQ